MRPTRLPLGTLVVTSVKDRFGHNDILTALLDGLQTPDGLVQCRVLGWAPSDHNLGPQPFLFGLVPQL